MAIEMLVSAALGAFAVWSFQQIRARQLVEQLEGARAAEDEWLLERAELFEENKRLAEIPDVVCDMLVAANVEMPVVYEVKRLADGCPGVRGRKAIEARARAAAQGN